LQPNIASLAPEAVLRMSANPHANGGVLMRPTPFDMVVFNHLGPFHLAADALNRVERLRPEAGYAQQEIREQLIREQLIRHDRYVRCHGEDLPEIESWRWSG
jgi:xylulose-5-phosphate/fructose-6-phosphate phosphoketolase